MIHFFSMHSIFLYQRQWNIGTKAVCRHQPDISIFNISAVFNTMASLSVCGKHPRVLTKNLDVGMVFGSL